MFAPQKNRCTYMKKVFLAISAMTIFAACQEAPKADQADATEAKEVSTTPTGTTFQADLTQTTLQWIGTKPVAQHLGSFAVKSGSVNVENNNITGGKFVFDINTLAIHDKDTSGTSRLKGHLLSPDFFDAANHPEASFEITGTQEGVNVKPEDLIMKDATHTITGNLTLKGVSKSISFPAKLSVTENKIVADANFNIDRTQWGLVYGNDQNLGDKFIKPTVNIAIKLVADKL